MGVLREAKLSPSECSAALAGAELPNPRFSFPRKEGTQACPRGTRESSCSCCRQNSAPAASLWVHRKLFASLLQHSQRCPAPDPGKTGDFPRKTWRLSLVWNSPLGCAEAWISAQGGSIPLRSSSRCLGLFCDNLCTAR